jgi:hypothetical protein
MSLAGLGRCDQATEEATAAAGSSVSNPTIHYYAGVAFAVCHDYEDAVRHTVRALQGGSVVDVRTNPDLKPLLDDPAVRELLR